MFRFVEERSIFRPFEQAALSPAGLAGLATAALNQGRGLE